MDKKKIFFALITLVISVLLLIVVINCISKIEREIIKKFLITILVIIQILIYSYSYIGVHPQYRYSQDWSDDMIFTSYKIAEKFNITDTVYRIKDLNYNVITELINHVKNRGFSEEDPQVKSWKASIEFLYTQLYQYK